MTGDHTPQILTAEELWVHLGAEHPDILEQDTLQLWELSDAHDTQHEVDELLEANDRAFADITDESRAQASIDDNWRKGDGTGVHG